jgi:hypothetical protein
LIKSFLKERKEICLEEFNELIKSTSNEETKKKILFNLETVFKKISRKSILCERKCRTCDRECVLIRNHRVNCNCMTDHKCAETCEVLEKCIEDKNSW